MSDAKLLIIHQGAFILTFPAVIRLQACYRSIDVLCQSQLGQLANSLGLAEKWLPLEAACWASLFSDQIDPKIRTLLGAYDKIILFSLSEQLEKSINRLADKPACRIPPRPPVHKRIHVAQFILDGVYRCGLIKKTDTALDSVPLPAERTKNIAAPGRRQHPQTLAVGRFPSGGGHAGRRWIKAGIRSGAGGRNAGG